MNTILRHAMFGAAATCLAAVCPRAHASDSDGWTWMVAPYLWAASISSDLNRTVPPFGSASTDTDFDDIIDKIDGAFQMHAEGQGDNFGLFADITYLSLSDSNDRTRFSSDTDLDNTLFELAAVWNFGEGRYNGLDLFAGLRYIDSDLTVRLDPANPDFNSVKIDASETVNDFMIGARYTWDLSDRWGVTVRGDTSFGDSDGTWNASIVANYKMKHGAWLFGYRYLDISLENNANKVDITLNGVMVGYGFVF